MSYLKEDIEKAKEHAAKQRARQPEHEESEMIVRTDDDLRAVATKLESGWAAGIMRCWALRLGQDGILRKTGLVQINLNSSVGLFSDAAFAA